MIVRRALAVLCVSACCAFGADNQALADFFETSVRPVFATTCSPCHTSTKLGGLELTSRAALLKGGNSGAAIVPGKPEDSLLIQAVKRTHERLRMPPQDPLPAQAVAALEKWVRDGAIWPESAPVPQTAKGSYTITPEQRSFWAFQPVHTPQKPPVAQARWPKKELDYFILAGLESKGLAPNPPADRRTLIRRVYFDLTGLPPAPNEVDAFLKDKSPNAYEALVDRLLASREYGERWGRYWLDIARYADDQLNSTQMEPFDNAHRYRNWVIQAFNDDMPYDQFLKAQLAGDLMGDKGKYEAGLGLFALSPNFQDDRIDALTRGFLGLTVACAQCHHHKFDPIPTEDYYALLGVFNSTKVDEYPLADKQTVDSWAKKKEALDQAQAELDRFAGLQAGELVTALAYRTSDYLTAAWKVLGPAKVDAKTAAAGAKLDEETLERWVRYLGTAPREHPLLDQWDVFRAKGATDAQIREFAGDIQTRLLDILREKRRQDKENEIRRAGGRDNEIELLSLPRDDFFFWRDMAGSGGFKLPVKFDSGLLYYGGDKIDRFLDGIWREHVRDLRTQVAERKKELPEKYPYLHILSDIEKPRNERVHIRGNAGDLGAEVPRRFLSILAKPDGKAFSHGSGRLDLAEAIADPENPLTARVMVNRIWLNHFGEGIVRTPSNFGQMGDRPSNRDLLDYLADRFVAGGWSIKAMHREILLSATYQQSSAYSAKNHEVDPDNRLFWRYNRQRRDVESLRDSMLAVAGRLDLDPVGKAMELTDEHNTKRTVYGYVSRRKLEVLLGLFDFPNPISSSERRIETNTPLQGLFLLNSEFVRQQAEALAGRVATEAGGQESARIDRAYLLLFGRPPSESERKAGLDYLSQDPGRWVQYAQVLLSANEFLYID